MLGKTQSQNIMNTWRCSTQLMNEAARNLGQPIKRHQPTVTVNTTGLGGKHDLLTVSTGLMVMVLTTVLR